MMENIQNALRVCYQRHLMASAFVLVILSVSLAAAQDIDEDELRRGEEWLANGTHEELIDVAKLLMDSTRLLASGIDEDEFTSSTAPFNVAAAVKYSSEYEWRSRNTTMSPKLKNEFRTVAANLAYDAVAEAADGAELCAEMAAVTDGKETAEFAAQLAGGYYKLAEEFRGRVRESEATAAGQRLLRARSAYQRADRFAKRLDR